MKERLIGAAVLVALGVWLIPWVLDGPERGRGAERGSLELPAPTESSPLRTQTIRLDNDRDRANPTRVSASPEVEPSRAVPVPPSPVAPEPTPVESAAVPAQTADDSEAWFVQLGSFGEEENARRLADRVKTYGFDAEVSTYAASGRVMHRVRVGPEPTRARAESMASSLSAHGFVAQVLAGN